MRLTESEIRHLVRKLMLAEKRATTSQHASALGHAVYQGAKGKVKAKAKKKALEKTKKFREKATVKTKEQALKMMSKYLKTDTRAKRQVARGMMKTLTTHAARLGPRASATVAASGAAMATVGNVLLAFELGYLSGSLINAWLKGPTSGLVNSLKRTAKAKQGELVGPQGYDFTSDEAFRDKLIKSKDTKGNYAWKGNKGLLLPRQIDPKRQLGILVAVAAKLGNNKEVLDKSFVQGILRLFKYKYLDWPSWRAFYIKKYKKPARRDFKRESPPKDTELKMDIPAAGRQVSRFDKQGKAKIPKKGRPQHGRGGRRGWDPNKNR